MRKALFLDRDGVINIDYGYVHTIEAFDFVEDIFALVRTANALDYDVIVVTNQSGIGRGLFSENDFTVLTNWMLSVFRHKGALISDVYYSPFYSKSAEASFLLGEYNRKPNPGMILNAAEKYSLNLQESILVGDKATDLEAGSNARIGKLFLFSGTEKDLNLEIEYERVSNLLDVFSSVEH